MIEGIKINPVIRRKQINDEAFAQARIESESACPLVPSNVIPTSVPALGETIDNLYTTVYRNISEKHGKTEVIARISKKWLWIAKRHNKLMRLGWINAGVEADDDYRRGLAESLIETYGRNSGYAFQIMLNDTLYLDAIENDLTATDLLFGITLVWFSEAEALMADPTMEPVLNKIADAYGALEMVRGKFIWDASKKTVENERTQASRNAARKQHALTTDIKRDEIIDYWRANISPNISNELAAEMMGDHFKDVAHRTLVSYVAKAKKSTVC